MRIKRNCRYCNKEYLANSSELKRGYGTFCSSSCSGTYGNTVKQHYQKTCVVCNINYTSTSRMSRYCSRACKYKNYRNSQRSEDISTTRLQSIIGHLPCELCGWNEATRDIHHIVPVSQGGTNTLCNIIVLCPNHHRMVHKNLISQEALNKALKLRLYHHPEFICQEPDAISGN